MSHQRVTIHSILECTQVYRCNFAIVSHSFDFATPPLYACFCCMLLASMARLASGKPRLLGCAEPPSMVRRVAVIHPAAGVHMYTAASAMSSTRPHRPAGMPLRRMSAGEGSVL